MIRHRNVRASLPAGSGMSPPKQKSLSSSEHDKGKFWLEADAQIPAMMAWPNRRLTAGTV